ncbi:hypothetical protein WCX49_11860 [Sulfurimonas sp. HSL-1656]|uniref:hypothetical protein n=1 Tax=Thiomicrolovo subterrani TaxID=3131934 RepID=UPI0031F84D74
MKKTEALNVRIDPLLEEKVNRISEAEGVSKSELVDTALELLFFLREKKGFIGVLLMLLKSKQGGNMHEAA